jgi:phosphatidylglycerophosphatase A
MPRQSTNPPVREGGNRLSPVTRLIATGMFSGYVPWGSGTAGTLVGLLVYLIPGVETPWVLLSLVVCGFAAGVVTSSRVANTVGHQLTRSAERAKAAFQPGEHHTADPSIVVIDEIVGFWITMILIPKTLPALLIGFTAFRAMDILKPQPARFLERLPHGWGIMLDDVVAGIYANILTQILLLSGAALWQ